MPEQSYFAQVETELNSFAQVGQTKTFGFTWTNIHDCNWVHRRLRYNQLPSYDTQLATLKAAGLKYVDATMPKEDAIQWLDVATGSNGDLSGYANSPYLKWLRISDYFPKSLGYSLYGFDGKATVDDIMQGSIGNCWFMAAASAIAEIPGRIERAFGTKD